MKNKSRRYEVLLPVRFNDGSDVPEELLGQAVNEIVDQFNAATFHIVFFLRKSVRLTTPSLCGSRAE